MVKLQAHLKPTENWTCQKRKIWINQSVAGRVWDAVQTVRREGGEQQPDHRGGDAGNTEGQH